MKNRSSIFDAVYYGADLEFVYNGWYYFINSGTSNDIHSITVYKSNGSFYSDTEKTISNIIYESNDSSSLNNTDKLFKQYIFDGKCLNEIVDAIKEFEY